MPLLPLPPKCLKKLVHDVHFTAMYLSLSIAGLGILLAFATYYWKKINAEAIAKALSPVHSFLVNKWYFDELYHATAVAGTARTFPRSGVVR